MTRAEEIAIARAKTKREAVIAARIREGGELKECICNAGFGMNLSCPIHGPKEAHPNG